MKFSIITVCYNSASTISDTILSVLHQTYKQIEYIVVDAQSKDGTLDIIKEFESNFDGRMKWISESDEGLYDAMNKGIKMATGDIIGILNADDFFASDKILQKISETFVNLSIDAVVGDIVFINPKDNKILRHYSSHRWTPSRFAWGYMPPHPSVFLRRHLFNEFGYYHTDYKIAADYELLIRFLLKGKVNWKYLPFITTKMRMGGESTRGLNSLITLNREIMRACKENGVYTNYLMIYSKYLFKPFEFLFNE